jgi:hypothetical protein
VIAPGYRLHQPFVAETEDDWTLYAGHRARLTEEILASATGAGGRICLLGAGRCNDVDLDRLAAAFSEIHLVDIDPAALGAAVARQAHGVRSRLRPHARVDLSGVNKRLGRWRQRAPTVAQIERTADETLRTLLARLPGPFDVVVSACVMTQMSFAVNDALGDRHPALALVRLAVMATHLNTMVGLTAPGGTSLFVSDLVSSSLWPVGQTHGSPHPRDLIEAIVASGRSYHSANPTVVRSILAAGVLGTVVEEPDLIEPWVWKGRLGRTYLVYALRIRQRAERVSA